MLQVRLLGQFDIVAGGKRITIPARAGQSLFAYLILNAGTTHRREKLAGLIWPDIPDDVARRNLRQQLWLIRKALVTDVTGDYLHVDEIALGFNAASPYWLDVAQLDNKSDDLESRSSLSELISTLSLYRGELLPGFYDDWVMLERERVQSLFENRMQVLMDQLVVAERWSAVLEWAEKWLSFGDTPEPAFRALMLAHAAHGDVARITATYQRCVTALQDELGVEPSTETRALYEGLVKGAQMPTRVHSAQPSSTVTFLFTDIEGSTRLLERLRDDYAVVLHDHHEILRAAVKKWNGREVDTQGDAFFVTFPRAADAIACAAEAQRALTAHTWSQGERVRVRMGLHTGEPLLTTTGYIGMDVHRAARIGDAGHGGQVLLSQTTRDLVVHDAPSHISVRDLGEHRLKDLKYPAEIYQLVIDGLQNDFPPLRTSFTGSEPPAPGEPPFKGLLYFDVQDAPLFFGREALTETLAHRLRPNGNGGLLVVVGASGSGKSSLVRAGLIPALTNSGSPNNGHPTTYSTAIVLTPTAHPLQALAFALTRDHESITAAATLMDDLANDPRALYLWLSRRTTNDERRIVTQSSVLSPLPLLVIDQFEELFTLCRDEFERQAFIDNLLYAINAAPGETFHRNVSTPALTLVLTLRADFYAHLAQYPELRALVSRQQEYIGPMTTEELRRAMEEPAKRGHWEFEPGLVDLILRDAGDEPGALPLLSHALLETWKRRAGHTLTLKGYHEAGGVHGAIAQTAETTYQNLTPEQQQIARTIFLRLTELGEGTEDTRRRASFDELMFDPTAAPETRSVLNTLAAARLITLGQDSAEVAHEALIREWSTLREWLNQDREGLRLHRNLTEAAQEWEMLERDPGALYRGARLVQAREWSALHPDALNDQERAFLQASETQELHELKEKEGQQKRELEAAQELAEEQTHRAEEQALASTQLRRRALFLAGAFVLALLLAGIALFFGDRANQNATAAVENALVAQNNAAQAEKAKDAAEQQERLATARELAASALNNLDFDPERSILLALRAIETTKDADKIVLLEAEEALHRAVQASHLQLTLTGHKRSLEDVAFSPDGKRVATWSYDESVKIWDAETGKTLFSLPIRLPGQTLAFEIAFSPDGKQLAAPDADRIVIWDVQTGRELLALTGHTGDIPSVAYSPDGSQIATGGADNLIKLWDAASGKLISTWTGHTAAVIGLAFQPDGAQLASVSNDGTIRLWDVESGSELLSYPDAAPYSSFIAFSPDGKQIAGAAGGGVGVWDAASGKFLSRFANVDANVVEYSPDGSWLATGNFDGSTTLLDPTNGNILLKLPGHTEIVDGISFSSDGKRLATASIDGTAKVWDVTPAHEVRTFTHNGTLLNRIRFSPDGTRIVIGDDTDTAKIWDAKSGTELLTLKGHAAGIYGLSFSPDAKQIATASADGTAKIWDFETGELLLTISPDTQRLRGAVFSPDGSKIATAGRDGTLKVWDITSALQSGHWSAVELYSVPAPSYQNNAVFGIAYSPDGTRLATGYEDGFVRLRDAATGNVILEFNAHESPIWSLAYSPDGTRIGTVSLDGTAKLWDAMTGQELQVLAGHTSAVWSIAFSPDSKRVATGSTDNTAKVWDVTTGEQLHSIPGHTQGVYGIAYSPDGTRIATASSDGTARVYVLDIDELIDIAESRLTRTWRPDECQKYLHLPSCP